MVFTFSNEPGLPGNSDRRSIETETVNLIGRKKSDSLKGKPSYCFVLFRIVIKEFTTAILRVFLIDRVWDSNVLRP